MLRVAVKLEVYQHLDSRYLPGPYRGVNLSTAGASASPGTRQWKNHVQQLRLSRHFSESHPGYAEVMTAANYRLSRCWHLLFESGYNLKRVWILVWFRLSSPVPSLVTWSCRTLRMALDEFPLHKKWWVSQLTDSRKTWIAHGDIFTSTNHVFLGTRTND